MEITSLTSGVTSNTIQPTVSEKTVHVKRFPAALWQRLKAQAALEGRTMQEVVAAAIQHYLDKAA